VLDVTVDPPVILRIGGLGREAIEDTIGPIQWTDADELLKRSPGTRHRHYAPDARVVLIETGDGEKFKKQIDYYRQSGKRIGTITHSKNLNAIEPTSMHIILEESIEYFARNLFRALRELDKMHADVIVIESVQESGIGEAIMDRLRKASAR
jgi:L-threonylcarbamoyladenylate synthase